MCYGISPCNPNVSLPSDPHNNLESTTITIFFPYERDIQSRLCSRLGSYWENLNFANNSLQVNQIAYLIFPVSLSCLFSQFKPFVAQIRDGNQATITGSAIVVLEAIMSFLHVHKYVLYDDIGMCAASMAMPLRVKLCSCFKVVYWRAFRCTMFFFVFSVWCTHN